MSKRESIRKEAERRGVKKSKVFYERRGQGIIDRIGAVFPNLIDKIDDEDIEDGDVPIVYAWRWSNDDTCAKIGVSTIIGLEKSRMVTTYHPTDDPVLIGFMTCLSLWEAKDNEKYFLDTLERTRPDREWVEIDEEFNRIIDEAFISDPNVLHKIFGKNIKTEKSYNENS